MTLICWTGWELCSAFRSAGSISICSFFLPRWAFWSCAIIDRIWIHFGHSIPYALGMVRTSVPWSHTGVKKSLDIKPIDAWSLYRIRSLRSIKPCLNVIYVNRYQKWKIGKIRINKQGLSRRLYEPPLPNWSWCSCLQFQLVAWWNAIGNRLDGTSNLFTVFCCWHLRNQSWDW